MGADAQKAHSPPNKKNWNWKRRPSLSPNQEISIDVALTRAGMPCFTKPEIKRHSEYSDGRPQYQGTAKVTDFEAGLHRLLFSSTNGLS